MELPLPGSIKKPPQNRVPGRPVSTNQLNFYKLRTLLNHPDLLDLHEED